MIRKVFALLLALCLALPAAADPEAEIRALYAAFVAAQNARDIDAVRPLTDGRPVWGREAMLDRMAGFQTAEVWLVEPDYAASRVVMLDADSAVFHIPLVLVIGSKANPSRLPWLVEVICQKEGDTWRIAGLYTAEDKR
ncbi:MAG: hypothetical protein B7X99_16020 [Rhizobiales bacterium 17-65-6]|nr:MAG: hypothetical protein B7X99_16020 [Rhizobiales bacterium 17-65-6]